MDVFSLLAAALMICEKNFWRIKVLPNVPMVLQMPMNHPLNIFFIMSNTIYTAPPIQNSIKYICLNVIAIQNHDVFHVVFCNTSLSYPLLDYRDKKTVFTDWQV